jgi:MerR family mercuric resistance operon transcriptional regulator
MTIGRVAKQAGVNVETVRFYERKGLVETPKRADSGYRQYRQETVKRIRFIKRAKDLGFTLKEIGELLTIRTEPGASCADVKIRAGAKIADIDGRISELTKMKNALVTLARECRTSGPVAECPILEAMEPEEEK